MVAFMFELYIVHFLIKFIIINLEAKNWLKFFKGKKVANSTWTPWNRVKQYTQLRPC